MLVGYGLSRSKQSTDDLADLVWSRSFYKQAGFTRNWIPAYGVLLLWTVLLFCVLLLFGTR